MIFKASSGASATVLRNAREMCSLASGRLDNRVRHSWIFDTFEVFMAWMNWLSSSRFASIRGSKILGSAAGWGACTPSPSAHPEKSRRACVA